jgi:hypothetical protein
VNNLRFLGVRRKFKFPMPGNGPKALLFILSGDLVVDVCSKSVEGEKGDDSNLRKIVF